LNTVEYISSGIIESYVLGQLNTSERADVEAMASKHAEIKAEMVAIEEAVSAFALSHSKIPPNHLKQQILSKIELNDKKETKVVSINQSKTSYAMWLVAASITLLIVSSIYNYTLINKLKTAEKNMVAVNSEKEKIAKEYESQTASYNDMAQQMTIIMQPENKKVMLKGMDVAPNAIAAVYWNQSTKDVYINVNALPMPTTDKQYQLWAIVDGKPVDVGVFEMGKDSSSLQKMKSIIGAQAFAVTLEKKGGSPTPTMTAMYLMGNV
jgi:anti-sigma-K factor RskA